MPPRISDLSAEKQRLFENIGKNETAAQGAFPNEQWVNASSVNIKQNGPEYEMPKNLENIKIAKSRITPSKNKKTISDNDARTLAKEIRQAGVLADRGASVFILPKIRAADGRFIPGPDALVNGIFYEFKTVTGGIDMVERRFRQSRDQGQNVFIRVMNPNIIKSDILRKIFGVVNSSDYSGGFEGEMIFSVRQGNFEALHSARIRDLKK